MSVDNPKGRSPEGRSKEKVFAGWVAFLDGDCWVSKKKLGEAASAAFGQFSHYSITFGEGKDVAARKAAEGAAEFKRITGFEAQDFQHYIAHAKPPAEK